MQFSDVTGALLVGGKSSRMGRDKAKLVFEGKPLYRRGIETLSELFPEVLLAGSRPDLAGAGARVVPDLFPGSALGGIYSALQSAETPWLFVMACDMPFVTSEVIEHLLSFRSGADVVVPVSDHGAEPLLAAYHRNVLEKMRAMLEISEFRIVDLFPQVRTRQLRPESFPGRGRAWINLNTPGDLSLAEKEGPESA